MFRETHRSQKNSILVMRSFTMCEILTHCHQQRPDFYINQECKARGFNRAIKEKKKIISDGYSVPFHSFVESSSIDRSINPETRMGKIKDKGREGREIEKKVRLF